MKSKLIQSLYAIFGLIISLCGLLITAFVLVVGWNAYLSLSENARITIAIAVLGFVSTVGSLVYTKVKDRKMQIEANYNIKKQELYDNFTDLIIKLESNPNLANNSKWLDEMRLAFMKNAILWANPKVLKTYRQFRLDAQKDSQPEIIV